MLIFLTPKGLFTLIFHISKKLQFQFIRAAFIFVYIAIEMTNTIEKTTHNTVYDIRRLEKEQWIVFFFKY